MARDKNPYLGYGIYSIAEAARLAQVPAQKVRRWVDGYTFASTGRRKKSSPLWQRQLPDIDAEPVLSFQDLMEFRFVDAFRRYGVSLHAIRIAAERARQRFGTDHPLSTQRFKTDGRTVFADITDKAGEPRLLDLVQNQYAFREILADYLYAGIEFSADDTPLRWWPPSGSDRVVVDPARTLGKPIVAYEGVPTHVLAEAVAAGQSVVNVAEWYEVSKDSLIAAIRFEERLAA